MAIKSFATNYLVADHDMYKEFMDNRFEYMKKNNLETDVLFCNGNKRSVSFIPNGKNSVDDQNSYAAICKWHCITISYYIWSELVKDYVKEDNRVANYKKFVNVSVDILKKFKYRVEKSIESARCDYNKRLNGGRGGSLNGCRYLAMFWTYLDLKKDCKTQRYFPDLETIKRAAKVFGYTDKENPFEMNGRFTKRAERKVSEEKPMEQTEQNVNISSIKIEDLELSMRTYNVLKMARINTLGDILNKTYDYLSKVRNMGLHSLREIEKKLNEYGYGFSGDGVIRPNIAPVASVGISYRVSGRVLLTDIIEDRRLTNPLIRAGIKTVGEFRSKTEKELLKIRTFGIVKLKLVKEAIANAVPKDNETTKESVIDIAEQAAKEVEEEKNNSKVPVTVSDAYLKVMLKEREAQLEKAQDIIADYRKTLNEKNQRIAQLENAIDGSKKRIDDILEENAKLKSREMELKVVANPKNLDTFALLKTVLEKMSDSKMEYILLTIDGMVIDIHPKQNVTIRTREAGYGRV